MQLTTLLIAAGFTLAAAQSSSTITSTSTSTSSAAGATTSSTCAAQDVLNACIGTEQAQINNCATNDYSCLCQQYGNLLTCYNNCPNDPGLYSVQQEKTQNCEAAQAYGTTTVMVAKSTSTSSSEESSTAAPSSGFAGATATDSGSAGASATSSTKSGAAARGLHVEAAGGLLAVVAAAFGVFM